MLQGDYCWRDLALGIQLYKKRKRNKKLEWIQSSKIG